MKYSLILLAAGNSTRMNINKCNNFNKVFCNINNKPLISYVIEKYIDDPDLAEIIITTRTQDMSKFKCIIDEMPFKKIKLCIGGYTRYKSVQNALKQINSQSNTIVIHDGARILFKKEDICNIKKKLILGYDGVIIAEKVRDTIKYCNGNNRINHTILRDNIWLAKTPQIYVREKLVTSFNKVHSISEEYITDEAFLLELTNKDFNVALVEQCCLNLKLTYSKDLDLIRYFIVNENFKD